MSVEFYGKIIEDYEYEHGRPYIGYFSPSGELVDYNSETARKHRTIGNIVSWTFLMWIRESECFREYGLGDVPIQASFDRTTGILSNADIPSIDHTNLGLLQLQRDLIEFLRVMENDPRLIQIIKKRIIVNLIPQSVKRHGRIEIDDNNTFEVSKVFGYENTTNLLTLLKDICIQYLRYDSIEKVMPDGEYLKYPFKKSEYSYLERQRFYTTSSSDYNIRLYNYLLMGNSVTQIPLYVLNPETNIYEQAPFIESPNDLECQREIESIVKSVPLKERLIFIR